MSKNDHDISINEDLSFHSDVTTELAPSACVECGKIADRCDGPGQPKPGDAALCIGCGSLNIFDKNLRYRMPTVAEMLAAANSSKVQMIRRAILEVQKAHKTQGKTG